VLEHIQPSQAFDIISEASGFYWWVDFDKKVNFKPIDAFSNPNLPTAVDGSSIVTIDNQSSNVWYDLSYSENILGVGTKAILSNTTIKSVDTKEDRYLWHTDENNVFPFSRRPFTDLDVLSITRERSSVFKVLTQKLEDVDRESSDESSGVGGDECFIWVGKDTAYFRIPTPDLTDLDKFVAIYNYAFTDDHENLDPGRTQEMAERTGGDGVHEFLFSKAQGLAVGRLGLEKASIGLKLTFLSKSTHQ